MASKPEQRARVRITVSDWAKRALDDLSTAKAYPVGILYSLALDLGCADLVAHFRALEAVTPAGLDTSALGSVLPGVDVEKLRRRKAANDRREAKKGARHNA